MANFCLRILKPLGSYTWVLTVHTYYKLINNIIINNYLCNVSFW